MLLAALNKFSIAYLFRSYQTCMLTNENKSNSLNVANQFSTFLAHTRHTVRRNVARLRIIKQISF